MAKRILIVEDEQDHRELLKLIFGVHGYEVDSASDTREAEAILADRLPDLMVLDVMLPDKDGWIFCETMKHRDRTSHVPVMMLSASAHMQMRFEGSCADDMLTKPFDEEDLLAKVHGLLHE